MAMNNGYLARNIALTLARLRISQNEFARRCGVSQMCLSRTMNGHKPHVDNLARIAGGLGMRQDDVMLRQITSHELDRVELAHESIDS